MCDMDLPAGLVARPHVPSDAQAVTDLIAAAETVDAGSPAIELEDIEGDWVRGSFDLATESIGVWDGDRLAAAGEVFKGRRADASVHPDYRGRGIGAWLADWVRELRPSERIEARRADRPRRQRARGLPPGPRPPVGLDVLGAAAACGPHDRAATAP